jgi:glycosyltransferase involved in cell wall biosynthesis
MRINFLVNEVKNGWEPIDKRLGGTEESIVRWAQELSSRGHSVTVYHNKSEKSKNIPAFSHHQGVQYIDRGHYLNDTSPSRKKADVCINVKSSDISPVEPTLYLTNETNASELDLSAYDAVAWPSNWALENIPVNNPRKFVIPHGYDEAKIYPKNKIRNQCLYASSPDRGLETLEIVWPNVVEQFPDAHLYVTYGGKLNAPNTTCDEFTEEEMNELYNTSDMWLHPCNGGELFGISGIKAQAAGAIPVYFPTMALSETVQGGIACNDAREMFNSICALMSDEGAKKAHREELARLSLPTWEKSTDILLGAIMEIYEHNSRS